jgi:hypothetical protein
METGRGGDGIVFYLYPVWKDRNGNGPAIQEGKSSCPVEEE